MENNKLQKNKEQELEIARQERLNSTKSMVASLVSKDLDLYEKRVTALSCTTAINEGTQVSTYRRSDPAMLKMGLHLMIEDVLAFYGAMEKVDDNQIESLISRIFSNYWWMKVEEIAYVLNKGKNGHYGKIYGIISPKVITEWLYLYDIGERENEREWFNKELLEKTAKENKLSDEELKEFHKNPDVETVPPPDGSIRMIDRERIDEDYKKAKLEYYRKKQTKNDQEK